VLGKFSVVLGLSPQLNVVLSKLAESQLSTLLFLAMDAGLLLELLLGQLQPQPESLELPSVGGFSLLLLLHDALEFLSEGARGLAMSFQLLFGLPPRPQMLCLVLLELADDDVGGRALLFLQFLPDGVLGLLGPQQVVALLPQHQQFLALPGLQPLQPPLPLLAPHSRHLFPIGLRCP
jgi:hypothetical protein